MLYLILTIVNVAITVNTWTLLTPPPRYRHRYANRLPYRLRLPLTLLALATTLAVSTVLL